MTTTSLPGGKRRWLTAGALVTLLLVTASGCYGTWGVRTSYRNYVAAPFAQGGITTESGATWTNGSGTGKGPFQFEIASASLDSSAETGSIQFQGGVNTRAHPLETGGYALELSIWNPRLELNGDTGTLYADLNYRPYQGTDVTVAPDLQAATDVAFATVDLSGFDWTIHDEKYTITDAPMVGIEAAMDMIGWDDFYGNPVALDPLTTSFKPDLYAPSLFPEPTITVSRTSELTVGDSVIVWGKGFDPQANTGTRPPFAGLKAGNYVVFGRFAEAWRPSTGAPSTARTVITQKWAVPLATRLTQDPNQTNQAYVTMDQYGNWKAVLKISELGGGTNPNYGIYTYPGSGATNAEHELYTPISVSP